MYSDFYGFAEPPFELTANQRYLFLNGSQREALSVLQYGLSAAKSLTALIGEAGTGKTTLLQAALQSDRCRNVRCVYLNNPRLCPEEFNQLLARQLDLGADAAASKAVLLERLEAWLRERRDAGLTVALVIDEAQSLSLEMLEEVRLLANIETPSIKLLPLVLAGQPELAARLEDPALRQLRQRVTLRAELQPFTVADTAAYIARRITAAGGVPSGIFTLDAVHQIHDYAGGIPRVINVICDNALVAGMALRRRPVDRACVVEVGADLRLAPQASVEPPVQANVEDADRDLAPARKTAGASVHDFPKVAPWRAAIFRRTNIR
jgi:type II secretory pathway predicted ATPase ExeA